MRSCFSHAAMFGAAAVLTVSTAWTPVHAQDADRINSIQKQINALQQELRRMRQESARRDAALHQAQREAAEARQQAAQAAARPPAPAPAEPPARVATTTAPSLPAGEFKTGGVTIKLGGFVEADGIYRSRNEVADLGTSFNGIPLPNSPRYHENGLRGTVRHSRVTMLVQGKPDDVTTLTGYGSVDFEGAAETANSNQSNSYNPRIRQLWASYDRGDLGLEVVAGQAYSLLTLTKKGLDPLAATTPATIDTGYVPGFTYARQPQLRVVKTLFDKAVSLGLSLENPQTTFSAGGYTTGANGLILPDGNFANIQNPGGPNFSSSANYSTNVAPDVVAKVALDPGFGHYEVYGIARFLHDRVDNVGAGNNNTTLAGGAGAGTLLPIIPGLLDLRASFLAGFGIGRYGAGGLPDATIKPDGSPAPIPEVQALIGLVGHPTPPVEIYGYIGTEQASRTSYAVAGKGYGYGSVLFNNSGCSTELSPLACVGNTSSLTQGTVGAYWKFLHGNFGTMQVGAQYSYTKRNIFPAVGGSPSTDENVVLLNFKYLPFE